MKYLIFLFLVCWGTLSHGEETWRFRTIHDSFTVKYQNKAYYIGSKEANWGAFENYVNLYDYEYGDPCPHDLPAKPDATITKKSSSNSKGDKREFFIASSYVRKDGKCLFVSGEGLIGLPQHRAWFTGQTTSTIRFAKNFKLSQNQVPVFDFRQEETTWLNNNKNQYINWFFFRQVREAFDKYPIDKRVHTIGGKQKPSLEVSTNGKNYTFYNLADNTWALQIPKVKWLVVSSAFAIFGNFDQSKWLDRYSGQLTILGNQELPAAERKKALQELSGLWSPAIKKTFHRILLDTGETPELKISVAKKLKRKPTNENMQVMVKALPLTEDMGLLKTLTTILRIKNPKGPIITDDEPEKVDEYVKKWQEWARKN